MLVCSPSSPSERVAFPPSREVAVFTPFYGLDPKEALEAYLSTWSEEQRAGVWEVATDLWLPYSLAVEAKLPNARITADRFHVMKNLNDQLTAAGRQIQRAAIPEEKRLWTGPRCCLLSPPAREVKTSSVYRYVWRANFQFEQRGPVHSRRNNN